MDENRYLMKLVCNRYKLAYDSDLKEISLFSLTDSILSYDKDI